MRQLAVMVATMITFSITQCQSAYGAELCWRETPGAAIYTLMLTHSDFPDAAYTSKANDLVLDENGVFHFNIPEEGVWADWDTDKTEMFMFAAGVDGPTAWVGDVEELIPQESCSTPGVIPGKKRPIVTGDFNCDGKVSISDTLIHLHTVSGLTELQACE